MRPRASGWASEAAGGHVGCWVASNMWRHQELLLGSDSLAVMTPSCSGRPAIILWATPEPLDGGGERRRALRHIVVAVGVPAMQPAVKRREGLRPGRATLVLQDDLDEGRGTGHCATLGHAVVPNCHCVASVKRCCAAHTTRPPPSLGCPERAPSWRNSSRMRVRMRRSEARSRLCLDTRSVVPQHALSWQDF